MKVAICVPSDDEWKADFGLSFANLLVTAVCVDRVEPFVLNPRTSLIPNSRFIVTRDALARGVDRLLFLDSDMIFPNDVLGRLLAHDKPIVGATYVRRREPHTVLGYGVEDIEPGATGLRRMKRLPAGVLLIEGGVFEKLPKPWWPSRYLPETDSYLSEDYGFCDLAIEHGYEIWCDLDLSHELGHVGDEVFTWGRAGAAVAPL